MQTDATTLDVEAQIDEVAKDKSVSCSVSSLDAETEVESIITCSSSKRGSSSKRATYSENEIKILREECHDIIYSQEAINAAELKRRFSENKRLLPLLKEYGFNSLKIKMRTERNKAK